MGIRPPAKLYELRHARCVRYKQKTRCDKQVPCGNCVKRNKAHLCHIVPHLRPKDAERFRHAAASAAGAPFPPSSAPLPSASFAAPGIPPITPVGTSGGAPRLAHTAPASVDALALGAFAEVEVLRSTIEGLRTRLTGLESVLVAAFGRLGADEARCAAVNVSLQGETPHAEVYDERGKMYGENPSVLGNAGGITVEGATLPPPFLPPPHQQHSQQHHQGDIFVHPSMHLAPFASTSSTYPPFPAPVQHPSHPSSEGSSASPSFDLDGSGSASSSSATTFTLPALDLPPPVASGCEWRHHGGYPPFPREAPRGAAVEERGKGGTVERSEELREEEVAASLSLESMALGRNRALTGLQSSAQNVQLSPCPNGTAPLSPSSIFDAATLPHHPSALFPTAASLARVMPPFADTQIIIEHALECTGWIHGCIHAPSFRAELAEFYARPEETRFDQVSPAWLALLFAQLSCGVRHMNREQLKQLGPFGLNDDDMRTLTKTHLDAALACLYRSHFLENHQLHAVQAITILVVTCQDGAFSNLFSMLLSTGVCLAQDLGLHRLPSEEAWLASVAGQPLEERAKSLIAYETRKRTFWALTCQDWFSIPYRRTTAVQPTQVTTPLPSNAHDEDLMTGIPTNRPPSEYTVVSRLLVWVQVARILQQVFQHVDENPTPSYEYILELDAQLQQLLAGVPSWFTSDSAHSDHLPRNAAWMRTTFIISSSHKVLTLHRAFFRRYEPSRKRALDASRVILREATRVGDSRMWTVPYHISAAASVVCLDLFQRGSSTPTLSAEREEVLGALTTLRSMSAFSAIAARSAALIENLLHKEGKLRPPPSSPSRTANKRRRTSDGEVDAGDAVHLQTGATSLTHLLASPEAVGRPASTRTFPPVMSEQQRCPADMLFTLEHPGAHGGGVNSAAGLGLVDDLPLPASFMSAFLETGFDPLDGAIMGAAAAVGGGGVGGMLPWSAGASPVAGAGEGPSGL